MDNSAQRDSAINPPAQPIVNSSNAPPPPSFESKTAHKDSSSQPQVNETLPTQPASVTPPTISPIVSSSTEKKPSKFKFFVIPGVIIILAIWSFVGYLYWQNYNLKNEAAESESSQQQTLPTPTPAFTSEQIKIENGNVIRNHPSGEIEVLVNKEDHTSTGITGFARVSVSNDNSKMCFESWSPATSPALYLSKIDGTEVIEVSENKKSCIWSEDDKYIYFIDTTTANLTSDIYSYNIVDAVETNLTQSAVTTGSSWQFEIVSLSADGSKLICKYTDSDSEVSSSCDIDLTTNEVTLVESKVTPTLAPTSTPGE